MHSNVLVEEYVAAGNRLVGAAYCSSGRYHDIANASGVLIEHCWATVDAEYIETCARSAGQPLVDSESGAGQGHCLCFAPLKASGVLRRMPSRKVMHCGVMKSAEAECVWGIVIKHANCPGAPIPISIDSTYQKCEKLPQSINASQTLCCNWSRQEDGVRKKDLSRASTRNLLDPSMIHIRDYEYHQAKNDRS